MLLGACSSRKKEDKMTEISSVTLKVSGMKEVNGFLWMGWPTAIVEALEGLKGIEKAEYKVDLEAFYISYNEARITLPQITDKIYQIGKARGMSYEPQIIRPEKSRIKLELKPKSRWRRWLPC